MTFIKDLRKGDEFTSPETRGTVYRVETVRTQDGFAVVGYTTPTGYRGMFNTRPLSTVSLIED